MNYIKAVAVPNQMEGAYYNGKLQLIVPINHGMTAGDWAEVSGALYTGIFRVTDVYDNTASNISALYFGDIYFKGNDTGTIERLNYNPIAAYEVAAPAVYAPGLLSDKAYREMIWAKMGHIQDDPIFNKLIIDNYKSSKMGYTQSLATNAIKELKSIGEMPMNQYGEGIWGQAEWVRANYPYDEYVSYQTAAPTTLQPGYGPAPEPVIVKVGTVPVVDPNPASSVTLQPNPGNTDFTKVKIEDKAVEVLQKTDKKVVEMIEKVSPTAGQWYQNPMVKLVLIVLGIVVLIKIFKSN